MATTIDEVVTGTLGEINIGLAAGVGVINPLAAQLDAAIAVGLSPFQIDLAASLDASLALQATLALSISDPLANIRAALSALVALQGALSAALALPPVVLSLSAELGAAASLSAALSAQLGIIRGLIEAAVAVKIPAVRLGADLAAALSAGAAVALSFDGITETSTLAEVGSLIETKFSSPIGSGGAIQPTDLVSGVIIVTKSPSVFTSLGVIITT